MEVGGLPKGPQVVGQLVNCLGLGGTERQLVELLRQLDRQHYSPLVFCLQKTGEFLAPLKQMGIDPPEFHLRGSLIRPNTALVVSRMAARLRANNASLLHSHDFYSNVVGAAAASVAGIPFIVSRRDVGVWLRPAQAQLLAMVTRFAPHVLCNAAAVKEHIVRKEGIDPGRIHVIHNGIDLKAFDQAAKGPLSPPLPRFEGNPPLIAMVANLKHPVKGHGDFLLAAASVARVNPNCRFVLVGDGELRTEMERRSRDLGIADRMLFVGRRSDVPALLQSCTIAVCASHAEGLSNSIMEAMAARLPVVATRVGGNPELVDEGRTGHLVPPKSPCQLAARLVDLLSSPERARAMGLKGRLRMEQEFSAELLGERMDLLYSRILKIEREKRRAA